MNQRAAVSEYRPSPRRGLSRIEAAIYIGIGVTMFDAMVADGRMPPPKRVGARKLWDVLQLDVAFDALPADTDAPGNSWADA